MKIYNEKDIKIASIPNDAKFVDLTGLKIGEIEIIGYAGSKRGKPYAKRPLGDLIHYFWYKKGSLFGKSKGSSLLRGNTQGKLLKLYTHLNYPSEYISWCGMKKRCYQKTHDSYYRYGAKGIEVCDRWLESFENFIIDMGVKPTLKHTIDRIDNNKNYCKENCKWSTSAQQSQNKSSNHYLTYNNETKTISEWAQILKINRSTLYYKLYKKRLSLNEIVKTKIKNGAQIF